MTPAPLAWWEASSTFGQGGSQTRSHMHLGTSFVMLHTEPTGRHGNDVSAHGEALCTHRRVLRHTHVVYGPRPVAGPARSGAGVHTCARDPRAQASKHVKMLSGARRSARHIELARGRFLGTPGKRLHSMPRAPRRGPRRAGRARAWRPRTRSGGRRSRSPRTSGWRRRSRAATGRRATGA